MYLETNLVSLTAPGPTRLNSCSGTLIETGVYPASPQHSRDQHGPTTYLRALSGGKPLVRTWAIVTAGLKWPPEVGPHTYTRLSMRLRLLLVRYLPRWRAGYRWRRPHRSGTWTRAQRFRRRCQAGSLRLIRLLHTTVSIVQKRRK